PPPRPRRREAPGGLPSATSYPGRVVRSVRGRAPGRRRRGALVGMLVAVLAVLAAAPATARVWEGPRTRQAGPASVAAAASSTGGGGLPVVHDVDEGFRH